MFLYFEYLSNIFFLRCLGLGGTHQRCWKVVVFLKPQNHALWMRSAGERTTFPRMLFVPHHNPSRALRLSHKLLAKLGVVWTVQMGVSDLQCDINDGRWVKTLFCAEKQRFFSPGNVLVACFTALVLAYFTLHTEQNISVRHLYSLVAF